MKRKIVLAITAASGAIYAKQLISVLHQKELQSQIETVSIVFSKHAHEVWKQENIELNKDSLPFKVHDIQDFSAPFASGSAKYDTMIVCPCSMGTLARIANGISDDLISRAADVILKERRKLILVTRETPLNLIHINNMKSLTEAGAIICPASPSFYSNPQTVEELVNTVIHRIIDLAGLEMSSFRWPGK